MLTGRLCIRSGTCGAKYTGGVRTVQLPLVQRCIGHRLTSACALFWLPIICPPSKSRGASAMAARNGGGESRLSLPRIQTYRR